MFSEVVHGVEITFEDPQEFVPPQIQEAQVAQARQIEVQRVQVVVAEMKIEEIR